MSDWAAEHTLNWVDRWHTSGIDFQQAIEGAVREALAMAAEVADQHRDCCTPRNIPGLIRALGAAK